MNAFLLVLVVGCSFLAAGCSESQEGFIADTFGMKDGVCKDGDLQYFPPECVPYPNEQASSKYPDVAGTYHLSGTVTSYPQEPVGGVCQIMTIATEAMVIFLQGEDEDGILTRNATYLSDSMIVEGILDLGGNFNSDHPGIYRGYFWKPDGTTLRYHGISKAVLPAEQSCMGAQGVIEINLEGNRDTPSSS